MRRRRPHPPDVFCTLCGKRRAEFRTPLDHRSVWACSVCVAPVTGVPEIPEHDSWADRVARMAQRFDTFTVRDLADGLGYDDETIRNNLSQATHHLARRGVVERVRGKRGDGEPAYRFVRAQKARAA